MNTKTNNENETVPSARRQPRWKAGLILFAKVAIMAAVIYFWYGYVRRNWSDLSTGHWDISWKTAVVSATLVFSGYILRACLWAPMLYELTGQRIPVSRAFRVSAIAWMGRYIPGKLWSVAGKAYLSARDREMIPMTGMAVIVEILWFQLGGVLIAGVMLLLSRSIFIQGTNLFLMAAMLVVGIALCHPGIFFRASNFVLAMMRRPGIERRPRYRVMLAVMAGNMATFLLWAAGFLVLAGNFSDINADLFPVVTGVFAAAWVIGFFMLLVPAGIGVRESILAFGLGPVFPSAAALISLVLASRILMTLVELICFLLALLLPLFISASAGVKEVQSLSPDQNG
ncbi:MAG: flippase-like domain-containing protein [Candidatus Krumholzibacteriota bacterium]|nr:flippase-like domain-containing protein [Candidatus Krumholzibacteriota bacterium]